MKMLVWIFTPQEILYRMVWRCYNIGCSRKKSRRSPTAYAVAGDRKVQTGVMPGTECNLRLAIAGASTFYPHVELKTSLELTRLESHRDEWEWNVGNPTCCNLRLVRYYPHYGSTEVWGHPDHIGAGSTIYRIWEKWRAKTESGLLFS